MSVPPTDIPPRSSPEYAALRSELVSAIEGFSSAVWTDYNVHDPGITTGEHYCFGTTEAAYVAGLPMADLLFPTDPPIPGPNHPAHQVLPCRPLTIADYRKVLIDQPGVRNAWLEEVVGPEPKVHLDCEEGTLSLTPTADTTEIELRGFYRVLVEFDTELRDPELGERLLALREVLEAQRNLCEVFHSIEQVRHEDVAICADLNVAEDASLEEVAAQALFALEQFLAPAVRFRSLQECLAAGWEPEEMFDGPLLRHGFIDPEELERAQRPTEVRASDLVQVLMDVDGVQAVQRLTMTSFQDGVPVITGEPWLLPLDPSRAARLDVDATRLLFFKRGLPFLVSETEVQRRLEELRATAGGQRYAAGPFALETPAGRPRNLERFETLLNLFPNNYGVGKAGLPASASAERQAQAKQFKAFMLLLEQFLSGQRGQVATLPTRLGLLRNQPVLSAMLPHGIREFEDLSGGRPESELQAVLQQIAEPESDRVARRLRIVDHLLARFAESYRGYTLISAGRATTPDPSKLLADKTRLLAALPSLAHDRAAAVNLLSDPADPTQISGLQRKLDNLFGAGRVVPPPSMRILAETDGGTPTWRFELRNAADEVLLRSLRSYPTQAAARADFDAVTRNAHDRTRYFSATDGERHTFELRDESGEAIAGPPESFTTEAGRDAAIDAAMSFVAGLPVEIRSFVIEHILLRPVEGSTRFLPVCDADPESGERCCCDDPYSFRITVVLPSRAERFRNPFLRAEVERVIREEVPAHIFVKLCWVNDEALEELAEAWTAWREAMAASIRGEDSDLAAALDELIRVLNELRSEFPVATLHDCVDGNDDNPVVLGMTTLGTLQQDPPP